MSIIQDLYDEWRTTEWGQAVFDLAAQRALALAPTTSRLSINKIVEELRAQYRTPINNTFRAPLSRELMERHPELQGRFKVRERSVHQLEWGI